MTCRSARFLTLVSFISLLALGCGSEAEDHGRVGRGMLPAPGLSLVPSDSILLDELEIYIGDPFVMQVVLDEVNGAVEELWVSDTYSRSIVGFDGAGRLLNRLGRPGPGPDELSSIFLIWDTGRGTIAAVDQYMRTIKAYDKVTGELMDTAPMGAGVTGLSRPVRLDDVDGSMMLPILDLSALTSLARFTMGEETWESLGPYPETHRRARSAGVTWLSGFWPYAAMDRLAPEDWIVLAFGGDDDLYFKDSRTLEQGTLGTVPRLVRRGFEGRCWMVPGSEIAARGCIPLGEQFSSLRGMWGLGDRALAVIYVDQDFGGDPPAFVLTSARIYVTILDAQRDRACVDILVAGGDYAKPVFDIQGGSLYVLDRRFTDEGNVETWLTRTTLPDMDDCPPAHEVAGWLH